MHTGITLFFLFSSLTLSSTHQRQSQQQKKHEAARRESNERMSCKKAETDRQTEKERNRHACTQSHSHTISLFFTLSLTHTNTHYHTHTHTQSFSCASTTQLTFFTRILYFSWCSVSSFEVFSSWEFSLDTSSSICAVASGRQWLPFKAH